MDDSKYYSYEIKINNIQSNLKQKDWTKEEYTKSIKYYTSHNEIEYTNYEKIYNEIMGCGQNFGTTPLLAV
jgi:hypothetical protein